MRRAVLADSLIHAVRAVDGHEGCWRWRWYLVTCEKARAEVVCPFFEIGEFGVGGFEGMPASRCYAAKSFGC